jgi:hypothetical protein
MNMTSSASPSLLSPEALGTPATASTPSAAPAPAAAPIVPVQAAPQPARVLISAPSAGADGALLGGGGPHTMPIQITGAADVTTLSLSITYDPAIVRTPTVTQGSFMAQGGTASSFAPGVDAAAGRIDLAFTRPPTSPGASGSGLLAAISFVAGQAGTTDIRVTGVATTSTGQSLPIEFAPARVTVR